MRGEESKQERLISVISTESRVSSDHPLRRVKVIVERALEQLEPEFDKMYSTRGRPSIPPEQLLKSMVLQCLYSVKSDRMFCDNLNFNLLFRWFLNMSVDEEVFHHSVFSKNRKRLLDHEVSAKFFMETIQIALDQQLISCEHFSVDGTLIEAWASLKSLKKKEEAKNENKDSDDEDPPSAKNGSVDFRGEKRRNDTHESSTDPEARIFTKSKGVAAKLNYGGHALMENKEGLIVGVELTAAGNKVERDAAKAMIDQLIENYPEMSPKSLGADKGYHASEFSTHLKEKGIKPHIAKKDNHRLTHVDGRSINSPSYQVSQRIRKRIEEFFGWGKVTAGLRKTRYIGKQKTKQWFEIIASSFNILRMANLGVK